MTTAKNYFEQGIEENRQKESEAFSSLMELVAPANRKQAIFLYVQATQADFWRGWYTRAQNEIERKPNETCDKCDSKSTYTTSKGKWCDKHLPEWAKKIKGIN